MGALLFLFFVVVLGAGLWRAVNVMRTSGGDRQLKVNILRGAPFYVVAVLVFIFWMSFTTVDTGYRGVVLRFGAITGRTLEPGPHLILPFVETVRLINVQTQTVKPDEPASSHDLQIVHTQVTLAYYTDPQWAGYIWSQLNDDAQNRVIIPAILEAIKARTAQYDAEQLIAKRAEVRDGIEDFVKSRLTPQHIIVAAVSITDFNFSEEYNKAIEAKVTAQQNALKAQNDLTRIQIEAQQTVARAQAEAKALELQKQQITPELIQLRTIEMMNAHWDGHLPEVYMGGDKGALPMLDVLKAGKSNK
ncbi:MAG: prohibitin family protein [Candidatus Acidiferrales bacterium]